MQLTHKHNKTNAAHDISEFENFRILRILSLGIGGVLILGMSIVLYFIYLNIFDTINRVHSIILLSNEYGTDIIELPLYEQVKKQWQAKNAPVSELLLPRNIFSGSVNQIPSQPSLKPGGVTPGGTASRSL